LILLDFSADVEAIKTQPSPADAYDYFALSRRRPGCGRSLSLQHQYSLNWRPIPPEGSNQYSFVVTTPASGKTCLERRRDTDDTKCSPPRNAPDRKQADRQCASIRRRGGHPPVPALAARQS
jgi:hypothetical protein